MTTATVPACHPLADVPRVPGVLAGLGRQVAGFLVVGVATTAVYGMIVAGLQGSLGLQVANVLAVVITAVGSNAGNRRLTFGVRGPAGWVRQNARGLLVIGLALALTSGSLAVLPHVVATPSAAVETGVLVTANAVAGLLHFVLLRSWVFRG